MATCNHLRLFASSLHNKVELYSSDSMAVLLRTVFDCLSFSIYSLPIYARKYTNLDMYAVELNTCLWATLPLIICQ